MGFGTERLLWSPPCGEQLDESRWRPRPGVLAGHLPVRLVVGVANGDVAGQLRCGLLPLSVAVAAGLSLRYPRPASLVLTSGFLLAGAGLVQWLQGRRRHRRLREQERALARQLRQVEQLKSELTAVVSHELRSPLTSILGFARTLRAHLDDLDRRQVLSCAETIERQARCLDRLVGDLLTASGETRPVAGAAIDLSPVAREVVADLVASPTATGRAVRVDSTDGLGAAISRDAARRMLTHLLDNALKFADPHTVVSLRARRAGDLAVVEVTNVGQPIAEVDRERIFEAFVQGDSSDTRAYGGIGLGLYLVRKIVDAHGGRVWLDCDGRRVSFAVALPATALPQSPRDRPARVDLAMAGASAAGSHAAD
ncbi:MAG: HAMP domain-containing histidine kinase [Actinomycetota bacterium]|nr:HAMP domain-containing histidine kinase [Actinomycetota bacterium]